VTDAVESTAALCNEETAPKDEAAATSEPAKDGDAPATP
jgi:hypothetical protein